MTVPLIEDGKSGGANSGQYHTMTDGGQQEPTGADVGTAIIFQTEAGDRFVLTWTDLVLLLAVGNLAFSAYVALAD